MNDFQKKDFFTRIAAIGEVFGKEVSPFTLGVYWEALRDIPWESFTKACGILVRSAKFFPRPVEFIEAVTPDTKGRAVIAFDRVCEAISSHGTYRSVVFDDPAIHAAIESMGGWMKLGEAEDTVWVRKEFERFYEVHHKRISANGPFGVSQVLVGRAEIANIAAGKKVAEPIMIGDPETTHRWIEAAKGHAGQALIGAPKKEEEKCQSLKPRPVLR